MFVYNWWGRRSLLYTRFDSLGTQVPYVQRGICEIPRRNWAHQSSNTYPQILFNPTGFVPSACCQLATTLLKASAATESGKRNWGLSKRIGKSFSKRNSWRFELVTTQLLEVRACPNSTPPPLYSWFFFFMGWHTCWYINASSYK